MYIFIIRFFLNFFDKLHQKKIINFLKKKLKSKSIIAIDVGAHHGEFIKLLSNNFKIKIIYAFEASPINYSKLINNFNLSQKYKIYDLGLSNVNKKGFINQAAESSSSTINKINFKSKYLKKKKKILNIKSNKIFFKKIPISTVRLDNFIISNNIKSIDLLKIDTEGYEYNVLRGALKSLHRIKYIYFEHHYDDMIIKNYTFSNIHRILMQNNFRRVLKSKMLFRKSFEYLYCRNFLNN